MISVIIPVFNSPKELDFLLSSLLKNTDMAHVDEILIGDDASDEVTEDLIAHYVDREYKIRHVRREQNIGFLANVNDLFSSALSEYVVLMNSDTIVPPAWEERVLRAMQSSEEVALACPFTTNATNLVLRPNDGQHWMDVDSILFNKTPTYPPCNPIVGFFVCIRRKLFVSEPLLDPTFGKGYWEDTDLNFRSKSRGFKNIVIDNLLVFHSKHSPSFSIEHNLVDINDHNSAIFMRRWRREFEASIKEVSLLGLPATRHSLRDGVTLAARNRRDYQVLFVLPAAVPAVGGISVVLDLVDELNHRGIQAASYVYGQCDESFISERYQSSPFRSVEAVKKTVKSCRYVISTSGDSHDLAAGLANYFGSKLGNLAQGPEMAFNGGKFAQEILGNYCKNDIIISVSEYLDEYIRAGGKSSVGLPLGPSKLRFYPSNKTRNKKAIAVCLRENPLKGTGLALSVALMAQRAGYVVHTFGHDAEAWHLESSDIVSHGPLHGRRLKDLFSSVGYYVDCSYMEGLGLLPLEAAFCGAIPIVRSLHGLHGILQDGKNCHLLTSDFISDEFFTTLSQSAKEDNLREEASNLRASVSLEDAVEKFISVLQLSPKPFKGEELPIAEETHNGRSAQEWERLISHNEHLQGHIEQIRTSTIWRLSGPLRVIGRKLKGIS